MRTYHHVEEVKVYQIRDDDGNLVGPTFRSKEEAVALKSELDAFEAAKGRKVTA